MTEDGTANLTLPAGQQAIRDKCFHPSGTFVEFPIEDVETSIPARFEKIARQYPNQIAVKLGAQQITYGELNKTANRVAHAIVAKLGEGQEPIVLFIERGTSLVVATMAVLKAGKIAIHADPATPRDRICHIVNQSQAALVLVSRRSGALAQDWIGPRQETIDIELLHAGSEEANLDLPISPDSYAEISFTSGSTGRAKGAVITHRQRLHEAMTFADLYHICPQDRLGNFGPGSIGKQLFYALLNGATQYPVSDHAQSLLNLADWLLEEEITIFVSLPTAFRHLINTAPRGESFPNLRIIRLCGEPLIKRDVELYQQTFSTQCVLVSMYASKETGTVSQYLIDKRTVISGGRVPVGYPENGISLFLVDDLGNTLPSGQVGEIVVQSYFPRPEPWQGQVKNNLGDVQSARQDQHLYFTGDIGRLSDEGLLEHFGRKDSMVKIRSFRVDIGEVEAKLSDHPEVREAVVLAKDDSSGEKTLAAYFVPLGNASPTVTNLRNFLRQELPNYMIPRSFVALSQFPLLATGKVNRRALPDAGNSRPSLDVPYTPPNSSIETTLAQIWAKALEVDAVGIHDNFFDLGGHSLTASRIISQVIQSLKLELPVKALFEAPTVAQMATVISEASHQRANDADLARMLSEVEAMTDAEVEQRLARPADK